METPLAAWGCRGAATAVASGRRERTLLVTRGRTTRWTSRASCVVGAGAEAGEVAGWVAVAVEGGMVAPTALLRATGRPR